MKKIRKKRALTLLEIMIVIFLIGLIGSVIGYNMKGSLDEGKYFKTKQAAKQVRDILLLEMAKGTPRDTVTANPEQYLKDSGLVKNPNKLLKDGWGTPFAITPEGTDDIKVTTPKLDALLAQKNEKIDD